MALEYTTHIDHFTVAVVQFKETAGSNVSISHPTVLLLLEPDAGYAILASDFSAISPLPSEVASVVFSQNGSNVNAVVTLSSFTMPSSDVNIPLCWQGKSTLLTYSVSGNIDINVTNATTTEFFKDPASPASPYTKSGDYDAQELVFQQVVTPIAGYYFLLLPTMVISTGNIENYSISRVNTFDGSGLIIEVEFSVYYTFPDADITGDVISVTAIASEIPVPSTDIVAYTMSMTDANPGGENRKCTIYGGVGAAYSLTYSDSLGTPINTFTGTIGASGSEVLNIVIPSIATNDYYDFVLTGDLSPTFDTPSGQSSTWRILQFILSSLFFEITNTNPNITVGAALGQSYLPETSQGGGSNTYVFTVVSDSPMTIATTPVVSNWSAIPAPVSLPDFNYEMQVQTMSSSLDSTRRILTITITTTVSLAGTVDFTSYLDLDNFISTVPTLTTTAITSVTDTTAISGGENIFDGGSPITIKGLEWSGDFNFATIAGSTSDGSGDSDYVSNLTALLENTPYFVRAFATNASGTGYGNRLGFTTEPTTPTSDYYLIQDCQTPVTYVAPPLTYTHSIGDVVQYVRLNDFTTIYCGTVLSVTEPSTGATATLDGTSTLTYPCGDIKNCGIPYTVPV